MEFFYKKNVDALFGVVEMRENRTQTVAVTDKQFLMVERCTEGLQDNNSEKDRLELF